MRQIGILLLCCISLLSSGAQTVPNLYREVDQEKMNHWVDSVFDAMKRVGMIENYILPNYDILHTESREHVIDNIDVTYFRLFNIPDSLSELYNLRSTDLYLRPKSKW